MVDREWVVSIHESGHASVARLLRLPGCGEACIVEPHAGACFSLNHGANSVCALMAGAAAEVALLGDYDRVGVAIDRERWEQRVERHGFDETALWSRTVDLVRRHEPVILFLAGMLRWARTLDGAAIDRIVVG